MKRNQLFLAKIIFGNAILLLAGCSLDQRSLDSGMARIQLNTRSHTGGPARLFNMSGNGMTAPTASSYYVVDVEGEGIPREVIEPSKCVRASPTSSAMVPALPQSGEAERTEIELLVPVGANRKIRILRVDLNIPGGTATPQFGENPFRFKMRNPSCSVSPNLFILAEAEIPFLNGDQSVTLVEKASPLPMPNQCSQYSGGNQPPIANADVELLNYEPWNGMSPNGQPNPYVLWKDTVAPHSLVLRGQFRNKTAAAISPPGLAPAPLPTHNFGSFGSPGTVGGPLPVSALGSMQSQFYQWVVPVSSLIAGIYSASFDFRYQVGAQPRSLTQSFPVHVLPTPQPIQAPTASAFAGYGNLFRVPVRFQRNGTFFPFQRWGGLVHTASGIVDLEPVEARGNVQFNSLDASAVALAMDPTGNHLFVAMSNSWVYHYPQNGGSPTGNKQITSPATGPASSLAVVESKIVFVDQTQSIYAYDFVSPGVITKIYDSNNGSTQFSGLAVDSSGALYVSDRARHVIYKIPNISYVLNGGTLTSGSVPVFAGGAGSAGEVNGSLAESRFNSPIRLAVDPTGNLYVLDSGTKKIRKIGLSGTVSSLSSPVAAFAYSTPTAIAHDGRSLWVSDSGTHVLFRIPDGGSPEVHLGTYNSSAGADIFDRLVEDTQIKGPTALAAHHQGMVYFGDVNSIKKVIPACPVESGGGEPPRFYSPGKGCDLLFRVYQGSLLNSVSPSGPIARFRLGDDSVSSAIYTPALGGSTYQNGMSAEARELVYDSSNLIGSINLDQTKVQTNWAQPWVLPGSPSTVISVQLKSDNGISSGLDQVTWNYATSSILVPRQVSGAPIKSAEIVVRTNGSPMTYYKQRFEFMPVNPASVSTRLFSGTVEIQGGFSVCPTLTQYTVKPYLGNYLLNQTYGAKIKFNGNNGAEDVPGAFSHTGTGGAELNITSIQANVATIDGTPFLSPTASRSGTVSTIGAGCTVIGGSGI